MNIPRVKAGLGIELVNEPAPCVQSSAIARQGINTGESSQDVPSPPQGMESLLSAEEGEGMDSLNQFSHSSGCTDNQRFEHVAVAAGDNTHSQKTFQASSPCLQASEYQLSLHRNDSILGNGSGAYKDLNYLLGDSHSKLKHGAAVALGPSPSCPRESTSFSQRITLEQSKPRARVELDIVLGSNAFVQGDSLKGVLKVRIRKSSRNEPRILVSEGKVRILGFECIPHVAARHTFYQCTESLSKISRHWDIIFDSGLDNDGFAYAAHGCHVLPFAMHLPLEGVMGNSKGVLQSGSGIYVRYIAMVSIKVKDGETGKRSIAHFYRDCEIWPRLDPVTVLSPTSRPIRCTASKNLFMGGDGSARITASIHRLYWVAGQRCYVKIFVENDTKKAINCVKLVLIRKVTVFRPIPKLDTGWGDDPDACHTMSTYKETANSTLEMAHRPARGHASGKGWWAGVEASESLEFSHHILLPAESLSIIRGRLLEVEYIVRASISASLTSDVFVDLPIRIINFLSIDTPASLDDRRAVPRTFSSNFEDCHKSFDTLPPSKSHPDVASSADIPRPNLQLQNASSNTFNLPEPETGNPEDPISDGPPDHTLGNLNDDCDSEEEVELVLDLLGVDQEDNVVDSNSRTNIDPQSITCGPGQASHVEAIAGFTQKPLQGRRRSQSAATRGNSFLMRVQEKIAEAERMGMLDVDLTDSTQGYGVANPKAPSYPSPTKAPRLHAALGLFKDSSTGAIEDCNSVHPSTHAPEAETCVDSFLSELGSRSATPSTEAQGFRARAGSAGSVDTIKPNGLAGEMKSIDKASDVKKRIEAFEAKMRNVA